MGAEFGIVFDIIVIAVIGCMAFIGWKKGFAKVILNLMTTLAAFLLGLMLSLPIANGVYTSFVEKPLVEQIDKYMGDSLSAMHLGNIGSVDTDKIIISGIPVSEYELDYKGGTTAVVDLSKLDLSNIGITAEDLENIGVDPDSDLSEINAKTAEFSKSDVEKYSLGKLALAQFVSVNLVELEAFRNFNKAAEAIGKFVPSLSANGDAQTIAVSGVRMVTLSMLESKENLKAAIMDGIVRPNCVMFIRTIAFIIIFILVQIILNIAANATQLINKIPVIGKANALLGLAAGLFEGIIVVIIVCLITRFLVTISSDSTILLNSSAIDNTFVFKRIYEICTNNIYT